MQRDADHRDIRLYGDGQQVFQPKKLVQTEKIACSESILI